MNAPEERTTPAAAPTMEKEPATGAEKPQPLWKTLEDELRAIHRGALKLDAAYEKTRDAAIEKGKEELRAAIKLRAEKQGIALSDKELAEEADLELARKPELINAPACRELFARVHAFVEADPKNAAAHSALCLSGGGIRSATFALGVLQGLARRNALPDFAWLSTVSGGGYIGAWLSSWISRSEKDAAFVFRALGAEEKPAAKPADAATKANPGAEPKHPFGTEPQPVQHLRQYSNYLTPALGLLSGDGWAVAATVARNLLLNWLLIIPALLAVLLVARVALRIELHDIGRNAAAGYAAGALAFASGLYALANLIARRGKTQAAVLWHCVFPIVVFSAFATLAWFWECRFPTTGIFAVEKYRIAFYMAWGALTALLAAPLAMRIRKAQKLPVASDWMLRSLAMACVFALTGLAVWWVGAKGAEHVQTALFPKAPVVNSVPEPAWALLSRQENSATIEAWTEIESETVRAEKFAVAAPKPKPKPEPKIVWVRAADRAVCFGFPLLLTLIFLANTVLTGLLSARMSDEDREWFARASGWAFLLALVFCAVSLLVLLGPVWLVWLWAAFPKWLSAIGGGSALLTIFGGSSDKTAANGRQDEKPGRTDWIFDAVVKCAAPLFAVLLIMGFSLLTTLLLQKMIGELADPRAHERLLHLCGLHHLSLAGGAFLALALAASWCVNINKFSLHSMYRNRLIRAYLGATNRFRAPNLFTGFDKADNFEMADLRGQRPFHVVNIALNLVGGTDLAWQQRMAMSFTVTPLTCGSASLGYRDAKNYAKGRQRAITLGTALAISGAAVSPNHGYNSSPLIAFLLTFFNARLGAWCGNPGPAGADTWSQASPTLALGPLISEAFGLTNSDHPYVYLSDGGHFENLGLYEMVLRRCRTIVISDAGCDPDYRFEDLGNAVAKIRVDLGIRIVFTDLQIRKHSEGNERDPKKRGLHCAYGRIRYSDVDGGDPATRDGVLIYIKPAIGGWEPMDVFHYYQEHGTFPHEPTTDQWFTESQFESYRTLGLHSIEQICNNQPSSGLAEFVEKAAAYVSDAAAAGKVEC